MNWINVKDKLPEDNIPVLACYKSGFVWIDFYSSISGGSWFYITSDIIDNPEDVDEVIYWMPLPKPPQKGKVN